MPEKKTRNILVVDSDPHYCGLMVSAMTQAGYKASPAESIEKALALIEKTPGLDLIFLDIGISCISAMQMLREISQKRIEVPVFTVAGSLDKAFIIDVLLNGHTEFIEEYMNKQSGTILTFQMSNYSMRRG